MSQTCNICKKIKLISEFDKCYIRNDKTIVYSKKCKKCRWEIKKNKKNYKEKKCKICKKIMDINNFYIYQTKNNGTITTYRTDCKKCFDDKKLKKCQHKATQERRDKKRTEPKQRYNGAKIIKKYVVNVVWIKL